MGDQQIVHSASLQKILASNNDEAVKDRQALKNLINAIFNESSAGSPSQAPEPVILHNFFFPYVELPPLGGSAVIPGSAYSGMLF